MPQPVRTADGEVVARISNGSPRTSVDCSLLRWVEGSAFDKDAPDAALLAREIGRTLARLQEHGRVWNKPDGFTRPSYDKERLAESVDLISTGLALNLLTAEDHNTILQAAARVASVMEDLGTSSEVWGLGHFDLGGGNCLVFGPTIRPIDFSLCGFGHYLFDLTIALGNLPLDLRLPCLEGYGELTSLRDDSVPLLDAFLLMGIFNFWAFHIPNENTHHWLGPHMAKVAEIKCRPVLRGESFILRIA